MKHYVFTETLKDIKNTYQRITKTEALKRFSNGETIYFTPVNCSPCSPVYRLSIGMYNGNKCGWADLEKLTDREYFEYLKNRYELFNCNNYLGNYTAYYIITRTENRSEKEGL